MNIVEKLQTSKANIRQISILASIPEGRIYKWSQRKSTPTGSDLEKIEHVVQLISNLSKEQIKKTVNKVLNENKSFEQALKIATGNPSLSVDDLGIDHIQTNPPEKNNGKDENFHLKNVEYPPNETLPINNDKITLPETKKEEDNMLMNIQMSTARTLEDTAAAMKDIAKANLIIAELMKDRFGVTELGKVSGGL